MANSASRKGTFNGHTPRQHRASSRKGGLARVKGVSRQQQKAWSKRGGEATRKRWDVIKAGGA